MISQACSAVAAAAAVLTLSIVSSPATAPVSAPIADKAVASVVRSTSTTPQPTSGRVLPYDGYYVGIDTHHRTVRFHMSGGRIFNFHIAHTRFPDASLQGHQWHHTCGNSLCTRGQWTTDTTVEGKWNDSRQAGDVHFTARLVSH
ncbi:hypothetical protein BH09ACT12_BH09ACT12_09630 [soil metagenome]